MAAFIEKLIAFGSKPGTKVKPVLVFLLIFALGYGLKWVLTGQPSPQAPPQAAAQQAPAKKQRWTCAMHPHIRLEKPGLCPICGMKLVPVSMGETESVESMRQLTISETAKKLMDIATAPVERKFVTATVRMVGKVDYDESRLAYITAWVPGRLDRLYVDYTGVSVKKGDHMVYLYSPELFSAQEELLQALTAVKNIQDTDLDIMREMTEATVTAAREKLRLWGLTAEQITNIEKTGKASDSITIYAPAGGIVIHKNAIEGMYVKEGTRIYTIADLSQVWVKLDAYESDLGWLRYGQKVEFTTVSYPGEIFTGTISFIDPILNERTRTVKVRVNVPNPDGRLKPEMFVKAAVNAQIAGEGKVMAAELAGKWICPMHPSVIKDQPGKCDICEMPLVTTESQGYASDDPAQAEKPLVIPVTAALVTGTRAVVYVEIPDTDKPTFEGREIVLGPRAGDYYLVRSGLKEGELVVTKGNFKIDSALQIQAKPSMMTPEGGGGGGGHAGMDMSGSKSKSKSDTGMKNSTALSAISRQQLYDIIRASKKITDTYKKQDISEIRFAFEGLQKAVKAVDTEMLEGRWHMLWAEMLMRLTNDAVEGRTVKTMEDAGRVAESMADNINYLKAKFGLKHGRTQESDSAVSDAFRNQLAKVFDDYFTMQQALAEDEAGTAVDAAKQTLNTLKAVDMKLLTGDDHIEWMKKSKEIEKILTDAAQAKTLESLRESFSLLSQQLIEAAKRFGSMGPAPFYILNCPMAFDGSGANWLQQNEQTRNPYLGQMMLKCGGVTGTIPPTTISKEEDR